MRSKLPALLAQSSQILGLSNKLKHISELLVCFEKTAKNLTKFASKNLEVRKLSFPSVYCDVDGMGLLIFVYTSIIEEKVVACRFFPKLTSSNPTR